MQAVDRWLCVLIILWILNSLVLTRTNWTNSIDGFCSTNANWIRTHYSIARRKYCTSKGYSRYDNLYARNREFDLEIRYHKTGTEAFVCHDDRLIQRPTKVRSPMYPSMWLHRLRLLLLQPMDSVKCWFHCRSLQNLTRYRINIFFFLNPMKWKIGTCEWRRLTHQMMWLSIL